MKKLNTKRMRSLLARGIRESKKKPKVKNPDYCINLFTKELKNGWYYQIEKMYQGVIVHAFKPPRVYWGKSADYYLMEEEHVQNKSRA